MADQNKSWMPLGVLAVVIATFGFPLAFEPSAPSPHVDDVYERSIGRGPISPLPPAAQEDPARVALGRRLFYEPRLSGDGLVSCASCHDLEAGGDDGRTFSVGSDGVQSSRNAPTVLNSVHNFRQFWDGRAATLSEQVDGPLLSPVEMASTWEHALAVLGSDAGYREAFAAAYGELTAESVRDALATFERTLVTPGGPFDRWLSGDEQAIDEDTQAGYLLFLELGCVACHQGVNVGGNMYQRFGVLSDELGDSDLGRYEVTGRERDRHVFKVPGLRNVAQTAPYFHDGSAATLEEAVRVMSRYQLAVELTDDEVRLLVLFLESLSGEVPE